MYYVGVFIRRGVFSVADIYDNKPESDIEKESWDILKQNEDTELQRELLYALSGTLNREAAIQFFKTHQVKRNHIVKATSE